MNSFSNFAEKVCQNYANINGAQPLPMQRYGQVVFNTLYTLDAQLANEICGTNLDPFYWEDMTHTGEWIMFWKFMEERLA